MPFETTELYLGANKPTLQMGSISFGTRRKAGILKMKARDLA